MQILVFIIIGIIGGAVAGVFGLAGGVVIIPALVYLAGFSQKTAIGTYQFLMLFPISLLAAYENFKNKNVDFKAVLIIGVCMMITAFIFAKLSANMNVDLLKIIFGGLIIIIGLYIIFTTLFGLK